MDWKPVRAVPPALGARVARADEILLFARTRAAFVDAVRAWARVVERCDAEAPVQFREDVFNRIGCAHWFVAQYGGEDGAISAGLGYLQMAADLAATPGDRARYLHNIAGVRETRYLWRGEERDLNEAIDLLQKSLVIGARSPKTALFRFTLAQNLSIRFDLDGNLEDIDAAIRLTRVARRRLPPTARAVAGALLGTSLSKRFVRTGRRRDINEAIHLLRRGVAAAARSRAGPSPSRLTNLGNALLHRVEAGVGTLDDMREAAAAHAQSVERTEESDRQLPRRLNNLANSLSTLYQLTGDGRQLDASIDALADALQRTPPSALELPSRLYNLAGRLRTRAAIAGAPGAADDEAYGVATYRQAARLWTLAPEWAFAAARVWGQWASDRQSWPEAVEAYGFASDALDQLVRTQLSRSHKENWLQDAQGMLARIAFARAKVGDARGAVEAVERGRAVLLSEVLGLRRAELDALAGLGAADLAQRYERAARRWWELSHFSEAEARASPAGPLPQSVAELRRAAALELDTAVAAIRTLEGHEQFLAPPSFDEIVGGMGPDPVVYLAAADTGGIALVIRPETSSVEPVWLPTMTDGEVIKQVRMFEGAYGAYVASAAPAADRVPWERAIDQVCGWSWDAIAAPILAALTGVTGAVLIPCGLLGLLPLHAAWTSGTTATRRTYALDRITWRFAPNLRVLARGPRTVGAEARFVGVNSVPRDDQRSGAVDYSALEVTAAAACFAESQVLSGDGAGRIDVLGALGQADVFHLSCHGRANPRHPLASGLALANGEELTLRELLAQVLGARLAVLSACETAVAGADLPDEVVALPTGLLQAGVDAVVGSLWSVPGRATGLLMVRFYDRWRVRGDRPADALCDAQRWLRDTTNAEKLDYFEELLPGRHHPMASPATERLYRSMVLDPTADLARRDYASPYHWAGFIYVGA